MMRRFRVLHFLWLCVRVGERRGTRVNQSATLTIVVLVLLLHVLTSNPTK